MKDPNDVHLKQRKHNMTIEIKKQQLVVRAVRHGSCGVYHPQTSACVAQIQAWKSSFE